MKGGNYVGPLGLGSMLTGKCLPFSSPPPSINISRYRKWLGIECFIALPGQSINILVFGEWERAGGVLNGQYWGSYSLLNYLKQGTRSLFGSVFILLQFHNPQSHLQKGGWAGTLVKLLIELWNWPDMWAVWRNKGAWSEKEVHIYSHFTCLSALSSPGSWRKICSGRL